MKTNENSDEMIDTSKMTPEERAALELTEAARESTSAESGLVGGLFMGRFNLRGVHPFPHQKLEDRDQGDAFLERLETFLKNEVDPDEIDASGEIPERVFHGLSELGVFGIKIPMKYGGLGLSQTNYCRAAILLGSYCGNTTALISAHQSIGVPQPVLLFGTDDQKRRFLPRVAKGEVSAFALTEEKVGSDPARMETKAEPTPDGKAFILNGEKLWCTNGVKAGVIVVMAKTPPKEVRGKKRDQITAFIVEMDTPGVEVVRRCHFMGLRALYNGVIRFRDVRVPSENILLAEGKGLRVALTTLNTGRLTLPAACVGLGKRCLTVAREWSKKRVQWGAPIGKHALIAEKIATIAGDVFAMESMVLYAASLVDRDLYADVRLEAALCKLWASERTWEIVNETMQIRGGRGYETANSLVRRGEEPVAVERYLRDCRINTIFEGSSEIMRLFIAREALDPHLKIGGPALNTQLSAAARATAAFKAVAFYARWYPQQWRGLPRRAGHTFHPVLASHMRYAAATTHVLARRLFHAMAKYGPKLERQQVLLGRFVDIGTGLFAITAACSRAQSILSREAGVVEIADHFCRRERIWVGNALYGLRHNCDHNGYKLAQQVLQDRYNWLAEGIVK